MGMNEKQKLGLGRQDFVSMREKGFVYVDKTQYIKRLLDGPGFYFLSRPRRFGKSLFISTLENFFKGKRSIFKDLWIDRNYEEWVEYPVVRIDLSSGSYSEVDGLQIRLITILNEIANIYGVSATGKFPGDIFHNLIHKLKEKYRRRVVVLVDEYEKPLLESLNEPHFDRYSKELRDFYSILKNNEQNLELLFITGVTRFGHLNIFSGLNNLTDISLEDEYAAICGITFEEITEFLAPSVEFLAKNFNLTIDETLERLKDFYDGYHFSGSLIDIYNPYSLLSCLDVCRFTDKWFQTGSSLYLLDRLKENNFDLWQLEGVSTNESTLLGIDASMRDSITLLYQSGYLTIKEFDSTSGYYTLGLPNREVSTSLYQAIIPYYSNSKKQIQPSDFNLIGEWLKKGDVENFITWLQQFFNRIPSDVKLLPLRNRFKFESDFQFIIFSILYLACGAEKVSLEDSTSCGKMDLVVMNEKFIYIFEFKIGEDALEAINQIERKGYEMKWEADSRKIIKVGISFSSERRCISDCIIK